MIQKAEIIVEKFDEGITTRWSDKTDVPPINRAEPARHLAIQGNEVEVIGREVWSDIEDLFDNLTKKILIKLEYEIMDDE